MCSRTVAGLGPHIDLVLNGGRTGLVPPRAEAVHLEEVLLCSNHVVLLRGHVLRVLLIGQAVLREWEGQKVGGAYDTLAEVRGRG